MQPMDVVTVNHGVPWYGVVILAALTWASCRMLEEGWYRLVDRWQDRPDRVEEPDRGDGSGPVGRIPTPDVSGRPPRSQAEPFLPDVPPEAKQLREAQWLLSPAEVLHLATCRRAGLKAQPWLWADSVEEARIIVDARELATCSVCDPLQLRSAEDGTDIDEEGRRMAAADEAVATS